MYFREADEVTCVDARGMFPAVEEFYEDFQVPTDQEVTRLLVSTNLRASAHTA